MDDIFLKKIYLCPSIMKEVNQSKSQDRLGFNIKNRDLTAFHELYNTCFLPLQHYAMRYLYDWKEAEDMVQNAFISLWANTDKYDANQPIFNYLLGIIRNNCLLYLRNLKIQDKHQDKLIETILFSNIEESEVEKDMYKRLQQILNLLPEKQREVVMLHIVEKKKIKEIAQQMNIAETTVKTHFKRAMTILRNNLKFILFAI